MNALAHFLPKKNSRYDPIALKRMKKLNETMVWKVVYYGRCHARKDPNTRSNILDEYNTGDFVEVFDYAEQGSSKWLKIRGHGRNGMGKRCAPEAWILAVDPFCDLDLMGRASKREARIARTSWGQAPRREFDRPPSPERGPAGTVIPATDGAGPAPQVKLPTIPAPVDDSNTSPVADTKSPDPESTKPHPDIIDPSVFIQATQVDERVAQIMADEDRLRNLRLENFKNSQPAKSSSSLKPDGSRDDWMRGTKVSVWSASDQTWLLGVVVAIQEEGGLFEKLEVHYMKNGQRHKKHIPRYHKTIKARSPTGTSTASPERDTEQPTEDAQTAGWTEHFDRRTNRYYYNNKAEGKVLWDKDALKAGIISKLKRASNGTSKNG